MEYITSFFKNEPNTLVHDLCSNLKRINITKDLLEYVNNNKLQDKNDANSVVLNDILAEYFNRKVGQKLTYYEMQELMNLDKPFDLTATNGFLRPLKLSDDLCRFLEMDPNSKLSRIDVTKKLCSYIETHHLQSRRDVTKRIIVLDETLANLFKSKVGERITYFEMQNLLQPHFLDGTSNDLSLSVKGYLDWSTPL
jgi:chromatin remodeling complex protein RSC6